MKIYLGLGSNIGPQKKYLDQGILALENHGFRIQRISPPYLNPPVLPANSPESWYQPFWNLVVEGEFRGQPSDLMATTQLVEQIVNQSEKVHNAPRCLDIDILWWGDQCFQSQNLQIPHPEALRRNFVLSPMVHLRPDWCPPGASQTILELSRSHPHPLPATMAIINLTPDSFSDGGTYSDEAAIKQSLLKAIDSGVAFIDLGAESTRPQAQPLNTRQEWQRLLPAMRILKECLPKKSCRPWVSIDTYHAETLLLASDWYLDIANDVSGLRSPDYLQQVKELNIPVIVMHNLGVPPRKEVILPQNITPERFLETWFHQIMEKCHRAGLPANKIYFDPGIGFGKSAHQSLQILQHLAALKTLKVPLLVGHSRKSFLSLFSQAPSHDRDWETLGASLALMDQPVEILRVHHYQAHLRAQLVFSGIRQND